MSNNQETSKITESILARGWWIVGIAALCMALLIGLTPEGSLREELGYALRMSARLLCSVIGRLYRASLAATHGRWSLVTAP